MNHYVNEGGGRLTLTPTCFAQQCRALADRGLHGVGLDEAEAYLLHGEPLPEKSLLITFDDGYLDNYFHALPALYAYGHKAAFFPVADRLEAVDEPRALLADTLAGKAVVPSPASNALTRTPQGFTVRRDVFCNHGEVRAMEASGVFMTGAHGLGHYGVFTSPRYKNFFRPRTQLRTFYRTEAEPVWGMPDFPVRPGLRFRAFLPNPEMTEKIRSLVPQDFDAAAAFFADAANMRALRALAKSFTGKMGRYETDEERKERMWREVVGGKTLLEGVLGRKVRSLCWPWGRYSEEARRLALEAGFQVFFTVYGGANPPRRPLAVHRFQSRNMGGAWLALQTRLHARPVGARLLGLVGL